MAAQKFAKSLNFTSTEVVEAKLNSDDFDVNAVRSINIATYNLRFGGNRHNRSHWQEIFVEAEPDLFLVQETCDPKI